MESTLTIGISDAGNKRKLKELINELPSDATVAIYEKSVEIGCNNNLTMSSVRIIQDVEDDFIKLPAQTTPTLIVIDAIDTYKNLNIPLGIPVYATIQAPSIEIAKQSLKDENINIEFEKIILTENFM